MGGNLGAAVQMLKVINQQGGGQSWEQYWATRTPAYLVAMANSDTEIVILWDDATEASDGLKVYVDDVYNQTVAFGVETATITGLTANTLYTIKLVAYKGTNESDALTDTETTLEKWYLSGGISALNARGAYAPEGALSLTDSYINEANPGTNNAAPGEAPSWDAVNGWLFDGDSNFLTTGLVPTNDQSWSMIIKFSGYISGDSALAGIYKDTNCAFSIQLVSSLNRVNYMNAKTAVKSPNLSNGILCVAGNKGYRNGADEGITIASGSGTTTYDIYIGQIHYSSPANFYGGYIQSIAIFDKVLSSAEQLALRYRMRYMLDPVNIRLTQNYVANGFGGLVCWNMSTFDGSDMADPDQIATFAPTGFDMDNWLDACVAAGMKYAILTTKHYDGFCLWPTDYHVDGEDPYSIEHTAWYVANGNPDVVGLFVAGCRARGLKVGLYFNMNDTTWETRTGTTHATAPAAYLTMVKTQLTELLTNYGRIDMLWIDGWGWHVRYTNVPYTTIYNHIKAIQPYCVLVENSQTHPSVTSQIETYEVPVDSVIPAGNIRLCEEVDTPRIDGQWFAFPASNQTAAAFDTSATIKAAIAQANARNGTYLLAVTPTTAGVLPEALKTILEEIGT